MTVRVIRHETSFMREARNEVGLCVGFTGQGLGSRELQGWPL